MTATVSTFLTQCIVINVVASELGPELIQCINVIARLAIVEWCQKCCE